MKYSERVNLRYSDEKYNRCLEVCDKLGIDSDLADTSEFWWKLLKLAEAFGECRGKQRDKVREQIKRWEFKDKELRY